MLRSFRIELTNPKNCVQKERAPPVLGGSGAGAEAPPPPQIKQNEHRFPDWFVFPIAWVYKVAKGVCISRGGRIPG
ncbi:MAG: hypothetical protein DMG15_14815 [Acidobacteria bacterium]|nr:MAG: hypothetical protein DMG16_02520 [Acidobacteriota bacterium]PYS12286.1 MAG: hypothetical protein DMG15_14815 [Acidobacteriota bacterium]